MNSFMRGAIDRLQKSLGGSRLATRLAIKLKNQCEMIVGAHFGGGHRPNESGEQWLACLIAPHARNFVDVGGNVGEWSLMFVAHARRPVAGLVFEPHPQTAARLRIALQTAGVTGCDVVEAAASDRSGTAQFFAESNHGETSSLYATKFRRAAQVVYVKLCRLDAELKQRKITEVDVLKIDAEGHDFFVLLGAEAFIAGRQIKLIQFEYNAAWIDAGATLTRAIAWLTSHGYVVKLLRADGFYEIDVSRCGEFFKYSNFVAFVPGAFGGLLDRLPSPPAV